MMTPRSLFGLMTLLCWLTTSGAAPVVEESFSTVVRPLGGPMTSTHAVSVLVVRPADTKRHPIALLLHGRGVDAVENERLGRADYPANARYLADRGYAVLIPTRIGYGITKGPDIEYTGPCTNKSAVTALARVTAEMHAVLDDAHTRPWADGSTTIAVGESFGGLIAIALASDPPTGLKAVISVAAGDGGDSLRRVDNPCDPTSTERTFRALGERSRVPTLFLYSANDRFWGPQWPTRWYDAWHQAGGQGDFILLPADKNNGHFIFNRNAAAWHGPVEAFLRRRGLPSN